MFSALRRKWLAWLRRGVWLGLLAVFAAPAQPFRIVESALDILGRPRVVLEGRADSYFVLRRGTNAAAINQPVQLVSGAEGLLSLTDPQVGRDVVFLRVQRVPQTTPLDLDGDGMDDLFELRRPGFLNALDPADAVRDQDGDGVIEAGPVNMVAGTATISATVPRGVGTLRASAQYAAP